MTVELFFPYLFWIIFNTTNLGKIIRDPLSDWFIKNENTIPLLWILRYQLFTCALCFSLTFGAIMCILTWSSPSWLAIVGITSYAIETIKKKRYE